MGKSTQWGGGIVASAYLRTTGEGGVKFCHFGVNVLIE